MFAMRLCYNGFGEPPPPNVVGMLKIPINNTCVWLVAGIWETLRTILIGTPVRQPRVVGWCVYTAFGFAHFVGIRDWELHGKAVGSFDVDNPQSKRAAFSISYLLNKHDFRP